MHQCSGCGGGPAGWRSGGGAVGSTGRSGTESIGGVRLVRGRILRRMRNLTRDFAGILEQGH